MKTKAYKLAAELGIGERSMLEWLRSHGYPHARRADTIRADVAQAARRALGRERRSAPAPRITGAGLQRPAAPPNGGRREGNPERNTRQSQGFRVSFADLLDGHVPDASVSSAPSPMATTPEMAAHRPAAPRRPSGAISAEETLRLQITRLERSLGEARREAEILQGRMEADAARLAAARGLSAELAAERDRVTHLREDIERLRLERATLRQALQAAADEQATLEQACEDLQADLREAQAAAEAADDERGRREVIATDLESARQREIAWRTRALELERSAQAGKGLSTLLHELGVEESRHQAHVLRALLADREGAMGLIRAIQQVDAAAVARLVGERVTRVCAHPICNQVATLDQRVPVRVDAASECEICGGSAGQRWFARLVRECGRSGVRRLLVIGGGEETRESLRLLSQGQPLDLRLVTVEDAGPEARVRGRVEGCDVLVVWSTHIVPAAVTGPYAEVARTQGRPVVRVLGPRGDVVSLARAVCNRLARNHILTAS